MLPSWKLLRLVLSSALDLGQTVFKVNWEEEQACFEGIATELAIFYSDFSSYTEDLGDQQPDEADTGP
eukprot:50652-Eustigmatos_ZCMA.PRE.1